MSVTAVPLSQKHESIVPAYIPVYNHILVTPNQSRNETVLSTNSNSDVITFELSGDNCINLSKSYLEFELDYTPGFTRPHWEDPRHSEEDELKEEDKPEDWETPDLGSVDDSNDLFLRNTMNFGTLRVYNKTGTLLCDLDQSYNEYRDLAHQLANQYPYDVKEARYYGQLFDGLHVADGVEIRNIYLASEASKIEAEGGAQNAWYENNNGKDILHGKINCRFHFSDLYNTILSLKNDIYFGEVIYISFSFAPIVNWVQQANSDSLAANTWYPHVGMKVINPRLYVCYNKDPTCNANTINFSTHHPIDFTDFNVVQITKDPIPGSSTFNYNFSINSSIGSYVKFILYRAYFNEITNRDIVSFGDYDDRIRWQINDFVYTPDYLYPAKYQTWEYMRNYIQNTLFEKCVQNSFPYRFFDVLNFSTDRLTELKLRAGKDLASDMKITLDASNLLFNASKGNTKTIHHKFYIITGKQLIIGPRGVERVV